ncbi:MAG: hypothetical protein HFG26_08880 [Provencibacterium sp.]|jgi:hypothetical protein|nr:hypothetical protein [Provencibacterium sp.]
MTKANEVAAAYINDTTPGLYSLNRNYAAYTIEQQVGADVGFDLWDEQTVKRLIVEQPDLMPYYPPERAVKRGIDLAWGKRQITSQVTTGILMGDSIKHLADRLQTNIPNMNRTSAIRAARTAVTGAQNAGRQDSYAAAARMGIQLEKRWLATLDGRTRHNHAAADGQTVEEDKPFIVGGEELMYPGDSRGSGWNIYNCRCTTIAHVNGVDMSSAKRRARDSETGKSMVIENMTFSEWEKWVQKRWYGDIIGTQTSNGLTVQSISAHTVDRASQRGVSHSSVLDAIVKPLHVGEVKTDEQGRRSQRFIGVDATVNINPDTGNIATVWPTGKQTRKKYQDGD